jgi:OPA family glycerol-3-phosphate transporter-like MFS transporter
MLAALIIIRLADGYIQAFGSPGMVKINTAWFQRRERGRFAGIFGGVIVLGAFAVGKLGYYLLKGFTIPLFHIHVPQQNWRSLFFVPPAILFVVLIFMWLNVKNYPEEAGYSIPHDDGEQDITTKPPLGQVLNITVRNVLVWVCALAYFCTGFVRRAIEAWWVLYLVQVWHAGKDSVYYNTLVWSLPLTAFLGSYTAGLLSDTIFKGKRTPVAAMLYAIETVSIVFSLFLLLDSKTVSPALGCSLLSLISFTCNSTHSIIGTAVAMDLGGRKMVGCAFGIIDGFQYLGAMLAGAALGGLIDRFGWNALFGAMLPFSVLGTLLMTAVWLRTLGRDIKGS